MQSSHVHVDIDEMIRVISWATPDLVAAAEKVGVPVEVFSLWRRSSSTTVDGLPDEFWATYYNAVVQFICYQLDLSLVELAGKLKVSQPTVTKWYSAPPSEHHRPSKEHHDELMTLYRRARAVECGAHLDDVFALVCNKAHSYASGYREDAAADLECMLSKPAEQEWRITVVRATLAKGDDAHCFWTSRKDGVKGIIVMVNDALQATEQIQALRTEFEAHVFPVIVPPSDGDLPVEDSLHEV
jgi:hypothetical protein